MHKITFKGGKLAFTVNGNRGPTVMLLHGFLESQQMWEHYAPALAKSRRVIALDLPGHGKTDCLGYVHTMELMAEAMLAVLNHLKCRKAILIGHSMGGYAALAFAERYPDHVKGLCLFFSTARADSKAKKIGRDQAIKMVKENHKSFIRKSIPLLFRPKNRAVFRSELNALKKQALKTPKRGIIAALEGMKLRPDREILLKFAPYPVHFVIGQRDPVLDYSELIDQTKHGSYITYTLLTETGHMGFIEAKSTCLKDLRKFIQRC